MSVNAVLFVHGYSETSLGAYFDFPKILQAATDIPVENVVLSAFDSLDDKISVADLAVALEQHVRRLETTRDWDTKHSAVICHSTGAIIARRWMLDRITAARAVGARAALPSHLITLAGANHGSTLAQLGKSILGYIQKALQKHILTVGARVLTDLDYGSAFLLDLNRRWLNEANGGGLAQLFAFSMGGDTIGSDDAEVMQVFWQMHESGSDNTVRISGANLNYRLLEIDPAAGSLRARAVAVPVPHLILPGYSHFGPNSGILGNVHAVSDPPMAAVLQALNVSDSTSYAAVLTEWSRRTATWTEQNPVNANSTVVFSVNDETGAGVDDCVIAFADAAGSLGGVSSAIEKHSPIQNDTLFSSYSFYFNARNFHDDHVAQLHIEANSGTDLVSYVPLDLSLISGEPLIVPNQTTYLALALDRDPHAAYGMYQWSPGLDLAKVTWPPLPAEGQI